MQSLIFSLLFKPVICSYYTYPTGDLPSLVTRCNHSHCPFSSLITSSFSCYQVGQELQGEVQAVSDAKFKLTTSVCDLFAAAVNQVREASVDVTEDIELRDSLFILLTHLRVLFPQVHAYILSLLSSLLTSLLSALLASPLSCLPYLISLTPSIYYLLFSCILLLSHFSSLLPSVTLRRVKGSLLRFRGMCRLILLT